MICCLNPDCSNPVNPDGKKFCQSCSALLSPLLRNRFRVMRVLSDEGGFGRAYLAEDVDKLDELCVIKQLAPKFQGNWALKKSMELFEKEAQRLQQLGEHPQIPTLVAYFEQDSYLYLVQQFIDGDNLYKELQKRRTYSGSEVEEFLLNILPVLKFIHGQGVIHRDIKPQNIIRRNGSNKGDLVLIDFGSSKQLTARVQMKIGTAIGSHGYCPIEQLRDGAAYPASDLFSVGATGFHLLTGISPFQLWMEHGYGWVANWEQYLQTPVSPKLAEVFTKLLAKDIQQRYQSADEVIKDLTPSPQLELGQSVNAVQPVRMLVTQVASPPADESKLRNILIAATLLLSLGAGELLFSLSDHLRDSVSSFSQSSQNPVKSPSSLSKSPRVGLGHFSLANTLRGHSDSILSLAISPDNRTLVSSNGNSIKLWSLSNGEEISTLKGHSNRVNVVAITSNGKTLISGSEDNTIKLWNLATGQEIRTMEGHSNSVHALAISRDGKILADGSDDTTIKVWNLETGQELFTLKGHSAQVRSLAMTQDSKILVSGSFDGTIKLWNLKTEKLIRTLVGHSHKVSAVAISPNGNTIASSSFDRTVRLWNLKTGKQIHTLGGHTKAVTSLAFSSDGHTIASGSLDKTIKLWNSLTGKEIRTLAGRSNGIESVAFSPDNKTLVSGNQDSTIKIWRMSFSNKR
jgi:WD40 repeat protein/tRNA A-37 threonylcarbamoyl transferase component Bud32